LTDCLGLIKIRKAVTAIRSLQIIVISFRDEEADIDAENPAVSTVMENRNLIRFEEW